MKSITDISSFEVKFYQRYLQFQKSNIEFGGSTAILTFIHRSLWFYQSIHGQSFVVYGMVSKYNIILKYRIFTYSPSPSSSQPFGFQLVPAREPIVYEYGITSKQRTCLQVNIIHLITGPKVNSLFCFSEPGGISMLPETRVKDSTLNKKKSCFPKDQ